MPPIANYYFIRIIHRGHNIPSRLGNRRKGTEHVNQGNNPRRAANPVIARRHRVADIAKQVIFQVGYLGFRPQNLLLKLFYLRGYVPLGIDQGLLSDKVIGNLVGVQLADLNIVPEYLVVAQLHGLNSCLFPVSYTHLTLPTNSRV